MGDPNAKARERDIIGRLQPLRPEFQLIPRLTIELMPGGVHIVSEPGDHSQPKRSVGPAEPDVIGRVVANWVADNLAACVTAQ